MDMNYFLKFVLPAIIAIVVAVVVERVLSGLISRYERKKGLKKDHSQLLRLIIRWSIIVTLVIVVASIFGIGVGNLWATMAGILAMVIIGFFAMWSILSNILATIVILVSRPFHIGDRVTILPENLSGEAIEIGLLYSKLRTDAGEIMTVPNITFLTKFVSVLSPKK